MSDGTSKTNKGCFSKTDPARAAAAGRIGGSMSKGNFAHDPERAREAGRKGGKASKGRPATGASFAAGDADDRAAAAGRLSRRAV